MASRVIKLTTKRQATFPAQLCRDLDLHPGDRIIVERREIDGAPAWILRPAREVRPPTPWFGALRSFAAGKSHDMEDIRTSIGTKTGMKKS